MALEGISWFRARHARVIKASSKLIDRSRTREGERPAALQRVAAELAELDHLLEQVLGLLSGLPGQDQAVARCRAEQAETRRLLDELQASDPNAREFQEEAEALHAQLEERFELEEDELLRRIEDGTIGDDQMQVILEAHAGRGAPHPDERRGAGPAAS